MTNGDWPAPEPHEERPRLPLPRVDDLPVAEQGYDREAVREAFDAFYRHAAQLDATLRTLEAVEVFQRTASELRAEMRTIRAGGWTVSSYGRGGYGGARGGGGAGVREWSLPPAFPRIAAEALFLIVIGIVVGVAGWSRIAIVLVMGLALAIVWLVEFVASRERAVPRTAVAPPQPPRLDEEPAELPAAEAEVAEQAEEGPEAMTILGAAEASRVEEEEPVDTETEEEPEPEPEPVLEPEAVAAAVPEPARAEADEEPEREPEPPPEVQIPPPSPIVAPGGAPPIPAPVPPVRDEPEPTADEAELAAAAVDAGDEIDEAPEAELAEELVAQRHKVAAPLVDEEPPEEEAADEDTLSGIDAVPAEPQRRRFRLFRRGGEDKAEPEATPDPEPAVDPWAVPTSERPADEYDLPAEAEAVDPWEQGPDLHAVAEPPAKADTPPPRARGWFSRRPEDVEEPELEPEPPELIVEPEPVLQPEPEAEPEPVELLIEADAEPDADGEREEDQEPRASELPVEVVAEQAAASIDRSRARRRRPPRRARRR